MVGKNALAVKYDGEWSFPAFTVKLEKNQEYGVDGDLAELEPDYRELKKEFEGTENRGDLAAMALCSDSGCD